MEFKVVGDVKDRGGEADNGHPVIDQYFKK